MLDILYPPSCLDCATPLPGDYPRDGLCRGCLAELPWLFDPLCPRCGIELGEGVTPANCPECRQKRPPFVRTLALARYEGKLREMVHRAKFSGTTVLAASLGHLLADRWADELIDFDGPVVPVPMHWRRRLGRRYNPARMVASVLARRARLPLVPGLLKRTRPTPSQSSMMSPAARLDNVKGSFAAARRARLKGRRVLLVDDVMTTCATAAEATRTLLAAGARQVWVAVAGRTVMEHPEGPTGLVEGQPERTRSR